MRMCRCAGSSAPSLLANVISTKFSCSHMSRNMRFQQCGILTSVDSEEPVEPPVKLRNFK